MNNITVGQIVGAIGGLTVIVGFFVAIFKKGFLICQKII